MNKQIIIDYEEYLTLEHINKIHMNEMNKLRNCVVIPEEEYEKIKQENKELKEDLKFVLEQVLGAFVQNWCIDWNFNGIRKKYNISDKYDWNSDVDDRQTVRNN